MKERFGMQQMKRRNVFQQVFPVERVQHGPPLLRPSHAVLGPRNHNRQDNRQERTDPEPAQHARQWEASTAVSWGLSFELGVRISGGQEVFHHSLSKKP